MKKILILIIIVLSLQTERFPIYKLINNKETLHFLGNYGVVEIVQKKDLYLYINANSQLYKIDMSNGDSAILKDGGNFLFSLVDNELLICEWENYQINEPDQYATKVIINTVDGVNLKVLNFHSTVRPINCDYDEMLFIDNYPNSLNRYYKEVDGETLITDYVPPIETQITDYPNDLDNVQYPITNLLDSGNSLILIDSQNNIWKYYEDQ